MEKTTDKKTSMVHGYSGVSLSRINSFSDAVFAVAITLFVLNIKPPMVPKNLAAAKLPTRINHMKQKGFSPCIA